MYKLVRSYIMTFSITKEAEYPLSPPAPSGSEEVHIFTKFPLILILVLVFCNVG